MDKNQRTTGVILQKGLSNHKPDTHGHATVVLDTKQATIGGSLNQPLSWTDKVRVTDSTTRHTLEPIPQKPAGSRLKIPADMLMLNTDQ